jgi:hypothetical protein
VLAMKKPDSLQQKVALDHVIVVGNPDQTKNHVRAWRLAGVNARNVSPEKALDGSPEGVCFDISSSSFSEKARLIARITQSGGTFFLSGALSDNYDKAEKLLTSEKGKGYFFDEMRYHPLIYMAQDLISEGRIGTPRILKLENLDSTNSKLDNFSLFQGLLNGVSCAETLLGSSSVSKVFSRFVTTKYSRFYVSLISFANGSSCQLIAGNSATQSKLEFSINGTGGMIAFNESKTLELPKNLEYSNAMSSTTDVEVLTRLFTDFLKGSRSGLADLSTYKLAHAIQMSAKERKPVSV